MTTADKVLEAWRLRTNKPIRQRGDYWRGPSPLRGDSDSTGFVLHITGDEHGAWKDFVSGRGGSLYTLARELGVDLPTAAPTADTKRGYDGLADYAQAHGVSVDVFEAAGWQDTTYMQRSAISFPTANGRRYRFTDGNSPAYINEPGYTPCWYGLKRAVDMATKDSLPLVLCNGEASTVVAQHYGIPACAITSGEKRLPDSLLDALTATWAGDVLLAYDCDDTGRRVAGEVQAQLEGSKVIDLAMDNHGDLADFCRLWGKDALAELMRRGRKVKSAAVVVEEQAGDYMALLDGTDVIAGKPLLVPFASWHTLQGFAHVISPGKLAAIVAASGGGKSSMLETIADYYIQQGEGGIWYGPEWTASEMFARRVQRYGGATLTQVELHKLFMRDMMAKVPDDKVTGELMKPDLLTQSKRLAERIKAWPGRMEYYQAQHHLEPLLETMGRGIDKRREAGESVTFAVFDYAQVLTPQEANKSDNVYEFAVGLIKQFVQDYHIVGIVGSQITKSAADESKGGGDIEAHNAQWLREDKFNLFVTLRLEYGDDVYGKKVRTNRGIINVAKNSTGLTGTRKMLADFSRLTWKDESWQ